MTLVFLAALTYYAALSAKEWTWVFVSADSGDWMASAVSWFVPQPLGSPLYVLLAKLVALLPFGNLAMNMTLLLSVLPSAISVALVYKIVVEKTKRKLVAVAAAAVLMGSAIFLTQSTVLEEYSITAMLLTLAYWCYSHGWKKRTLLALGLATAVHVSTIPIALIWLAIEWKDKWSWIRQGWVYVVSGVLPYIMVPILMAIPSVPPLMVGHFSISNLYHYVFVVSGAIVGTMSIANFPERMLDFIEISMISLGIAIVPLAGIAMRRPWSKDMWAAIGVVGFFLWYYLTNLDPSTWTFLTMAMPVVSVLVGIGLDAMTRDRIVSVWRHYSDGIRRTDEFRWESRKVGYAVIAGAVVLMAMNGTFLNASELTKETPIATEYQKALDKMPKDSVVVVLPGAYSMGLFYKMGTDRPDLTPLLWYDEENWRSDSSDDYYSWLKERGLDGENPIEVIGYAIDKGRKVYMAEDTWRWGNGVVGVRGGNWDTFMGNVTIENVVGLAGAGEVKEITGITGITGVVTGG